MSIPGRPGPRKKPLPKRIAAALLRLIAARPQGQPKLKPEMLSRILLVRYDKIGDMVITTPLIQALHRVAPQARIDVLASRANAPLIEKDPRIHRIHLWEKSLLKRIRVIRECRRQRYDLTLQLVLWRTTLPGLLAGLLTPAGRVVSRDSANNRDLFNHTVPIDASQHYARQVFNFFAGSLDLEGVGADATDSAAAPTVHTVAPAAPQGMPPYSLYIPPEAERRALERLRAEGLERNGYILLNISAGEPARELPDDRSVELIERLRETGASHGLRVAVTGAPNDAERVREIVRSANAGRTPGKNTHGNEPVVPLLFNALTAAAACIREARLIVTPDTGTNHIASAVGTPTVALFTKNGRPIGWGPFGVPHRIVQATEGKDAAALRTDDIVAAVAALLAE